MYGPVLFSRLPKPNFLKPVCNNRPRSPWFGRLPYLLSCWRPGPVCSGVEQCSSAANMQRGLLALLLSTVYQSSAQQRFRQQPSSLTVVEGGNVTLACSVENRQGELQWTRDDFGLGTDRQLAAYTRYTMRGGEGGSWDLEITGAKLEDDGRFQCQVGATDSSPPLRSRYAVVRVLAAPQPPVLTAGPQLVLREGKVALLQCISKGGKPASAIRWRRDGQLLEEGIEEKVERLPASLRSITVSTLTFHVTANMTGSVLECEASSEAEPDSRRVATALRVEHAPHVRVAADREILYEGDRVRLTCRAPASPALVQYTWLRDGQEVPGARGAKELVLDLNRTSNNQRISCLARNTIGQNSDDLTLDVRCEYLSNFNCYHSSFDILMLEHIFENVVRQFLRIGSKIVFNNIELRCSLK